MSPHVLLNKKTNFDQNETLLNMKTPHTRLERWTLGFSQYKNLKLKVKLWWVGARERKRVLFFVAYFGPKEIFSHYCFISMYSLLNKFPEYMCYYVSKNYYFIHFHCFVLKSSKAFSVSLISCSSRLRSYVNF